MLKRGMARLFKKRIVGFEGFGREMSVKK